MAFGLIIKDSSGNIVLDTGDSVMTRLGIESVTVAGSGTDTGDVVNSDFSRGTPWYYVRNYPLDATLAIPANLEFTFSGTTLTWTATWPSINGIMNNPLVFEYGYF